MDLRVDHVTVATSDLGAATEALESHGLAPVYGGEHASGATEMSAVGFPDGSYLEVIGPTGGDPPFWGHPIRADAGPCAWAAHVEDAEDVAGRLADRGVAVDGPRPFSRDRPDGTELSWSMAFLGPGDPGSLLPFLIADETPREQRARPGAGSEGTGLTGVERVVVGVESLAAVEDYRTAFDLGEPAVHTDPDHGVRVARFGDAPVDLATAEDGWLTDRLGAFGPLPCAFLLGVDDPDRARERVGGAAGAWLGREVAWLSVAGGRADGPGDLGVLLGRDGDTGGGQQI